MNGAVTSATMAKPRAPRRAVAGHANLLTAFAAAQHEGRTVAKRGRNDDGNWGRGFDYARAEDIIIEGKGILARHGLAVLPGATSLRPSAIAVGAVELVARFVLVHPSTGEREDLGERVWPVIAGDDQTLGNAHASADTSLLAYFLRGLLQLPRVEEGTDVAIVNSARGHAPASAQVFVRAHGGSGSGSRRAGGSPRAADVSIAKLTRAVDTEMARLEIADEERDNKARRVLGRDPTTGADLRELVRKLKGERKQ